MADSDRVMVDLRQRLKERDGIINSLRSQLDESIIEQESLLRRCDSLTKEAEGLQEQFASQAALIDDLNRKL